MMSRYFVRGALCIIVLMRQRKKRLWCLALSSASLLGVIFVVFFVDPEYSVSFLSFSLTIVFLFFLLTFLFVFGVVSYFLANIVRGVLAGVFAVSFLSLRYFGFHDTLYIAILLGIVLMFDLYFRK